MRTFVRIFTWPRRTWELWRAYTSHSPHTPIPANDGAFTFFLMIFGFEVLITVLHTVWIINQSLVMHFGIAVAAILFIVGDALYARFTYLHEPHAAAREGVDGSFLLLRRFGEYFGAGFIVANSIIIPLAAALTTHTPPSSWALASTTVAAALIAATSYFKMQYYEGIALSERQNYNRILAALAAATQVTIMVLIAIATITGVAVPDNLYYLLLVLLLGYVQHNHLLHERFPGQTQRRRGHLWALAVSAFTMAVIGFSSLPGLLPLAAFPAEDLAALFLITMGVFFYGTSVHGANADQQTGRLADSLGFGKGRNEEIREAEAFSEQLAEEMEGLRELPGLEPD